jgi:WS/DGAT/MGAT family acyltransferase
MDANFLYMETPETPMHGASLQVLELPDGCDVDTFFSELREHVRRSIPRFAFFHQRLHQTPLHLDHPVWVEAADIDLDDHLGREVLDAPGDTAQLMALVARLHQPLLERSRPLWRYTLIEGLASGHVVLHTKTHHACLDGMASQELLRQFYSTSPEPVPMDPGPEPPKEPEPSALALMRDAYGHLAQQPAKVLRGLPHAAKSLLQLAWHTRERGLPSPAPRTRFDVSVTAERSCATVTLPLDGVRAIAHAEGVTVNDLVLALCGRAVRRYLAEKDELPRESLVAFVPVSLRDAGDGHLDNQVFGMLTSLATHVDDPLEQVASVHAAAAAAKAQVSELGPLVPRDFAFLGAPALIEGVVGLAGSWRLLERLPQFFNVVVSNVPGPREQLFLCRARLLGQYPMSMPMHGCALNMTVMGYAASLDFGLIACRRAVPDIERIGHHLECAYAELRAAVPTE